MAGARMSERIAFRRARRAELPAIVRMLAADPLGARRERYATPLPAAYGAAFAAIARDSNNELVVALHTGVVIGVLQLTLIPSLTYQGGWRALIEGVRVHADWRSRGVGRLMFEWAIQRARARGCHMLQLTTDKTRPAARRFYEGLGFVASHHGMKLHLGRGGRRRGGRHYRGSSITLTRRLSERRAAKAAGNASQPTVSPRSGPASTRARASMSRVKAKSRLP